MPFGIPAWQGTGPMNIPIFIQALWVKRGTCRLPAMVDCQRVKIGKPWLTDPNVEARLTAPESKFPHELPVFGLFGPRGNFGLEADLRTQCIILAAAWLMAGVGRQDSSEPADPWLMVLLSIEY